MPWYCAHIIMYFDYDNSEQDVVPSDADSQEFVVWENIVLLSGSNLDEVREKAKRRGAEEELHGGDDLRWGATAVRMVFGGVRKIVAVEAFRDESIPGEGNEATYTEMKVVGRNRLEKLIGGEAVQVVLEP